MYDKALTITKLHLFVQVWTKIAAYRACLPAALTLFLACCTGVGLAWRKLDQAVGQGYFVAGAVCGIGEGVLTSADHLKVHVTEKIKMPFLMKCCVLGWSVSHFQGR